MAAHTFKRTGRAAVEMHNPVHMRILVEICASVRVRLYGIPTRRGGYCGSASQICIFPPVCLYLHTNAQVQSYDATQNSAHQRPSSTVK